MKNDFAKIIFHPQEPPPALPQATRFKTKEFFVTRYLSAS
jgi:hypothetical protein